MWLEPEKQKEGADRCSVCVGGGGLDRAYRPDGGLTGVIVSWRPPRLYNKGRVSGRRQAANQSTTTASHLLDAIDSSSGRSATPDGLRYTPRLVLAFDTPASVSIDDNLDD